MKTLNNQFFNYSYLKVLSKEAVDKIDQQKKICEVEYEDFILYMNEYFKKADVNNQTIPGQFNFFIRTTYNTLKMLGLLTNKVDWKAFVPLLITCELETINDIRFGDYENDTKN